MDHAPKLSQYAQQRTKDGAKVLRHEEVMKDAFSKANPEGVINLAIAENTLMTDYLASYFKDHFSLRPVDFTYGDSLAGNTRLRAALTDFFNDHFHPCKPVKADELMAGAGLLPIISQLGRALVDPGNAILLLRPYYHGFDMALGTLDDIKIEGVAVPLEHMFTIREVEYFEFAFQAAKAAGTTIQAVLLVNPQNPYGRCYPTEVLESYCRFCEQHDLHLISDEIYALSTFASGDIPSPEPFKSILSVDLEKIKVNENRVHLLYGMSKDFDANGFRAGVLHTRHYALYQALLATSIFSIVSSPAAELWATLLSDKQGLQTYIDANRAALKNAYEHLVGWLQFHDIPYVPSAAGHFLMADFRHILAQGSLRGLQWDSGAQVKMVDRELALLGYLAADPCKVVLNPGSGLHMSEPGWFRITFTLPQWVVDTGLRRVEKALGWREWPGLGPVVQASEAGAEGKRHEVRSDTLGSRAKDSVPSVSIN